MTEELSDYNRLLDRLERLLNARERLLRAGQLRRAQRTTEQITELREQLELDA